ncbi:MAG: hypothetical protein LBN27_12285 [Prevotellaceae bacterium]|jgi:hypothetical protein|nr:hypothetical protein [Prevotellaceae bacterium]
MALFSFDEITSTSLSNRKEVTEVTEINRSAALVEKYEGIHFKKIESIKDLMGEYPAAGDIYFLWTQNQFNAVTFMLYIIKYVGAIQRLTFSTYAINERIVNSLAKWHDAGSLRDVTIFISDTVKVRNTKVTNLLEMQAEQRGWHIIYEWNHSKVMCIEAAGNYFVIEGSGNLSDNSRYENYIFTNNKKVYEFRRQCLTGC